MRILNFRFSRMNISCSLIALLTIAILFSCKKDEVARQQQPVISYKQKIISLAEDMPMTAIAPDSSGGAITEYSVSPSLPKGIMLNQLNGVISGTPSDTLLPARFVVRATGPGGVGTDTLTLSVGTVAFNYGATGTLTLEKGSTDLSTTPLSPVVLAGTFTKFFVSPSPDSLTYYTGLKFNSTTGQISGTPTKLTSTTEIPAPVTFTITGISTSNKAASATISFIINDQKPAFSYTYGGSFSVNTSVGSTLTVTKLKGSGNILKYRLSPESPALPEGLTLDSLTGQIKGTPLVAASPTLIVRGLNSGGYQDVNVPLEINATAATPQVRYMMSLFSGNVVDTIYSRINSGNTIYLTRNDSANTIPGSGTPVPRVYLNPVIIGGQVNNYSVSPLYSSGTDGLSFDPSSGMISGTPKPTTASIATRTVTIHNAATEGAVGTFDVNIEVNSPFFTYNAQQGQGKRPYFSNVFSLLQGQKIDVAVGDGTSYPGYLAAALKPAGGTGVVSYSIYPLSKYSGTNDFIPFSATGLNFDPATGAISGTPVTNTFPTAGFNYTSWNYVVVGKKADGSFTTYQIQFKIFKNLSDWDNTALLP